MAKAPPGLGGDSRLVINKSDNVRQADRRFGSGAGLTLPLPPAQVPEPESESQFDESETAGIAPEYVNTSNEGQTEIDISPTSEDRVNNTERYYEDRFTGGEDNFGKG